MDWLNLVLIFSSLWLVTVFELGVGEEFNHTYEDITYENELKLYKYTTKLVSLFCSIDSGCIAYIQELV